MQVSRNWLAAIAVAILAGGCSGSPSAPDLPKVDQPGPPAPTAPAVTTTTKGCVGSSNAALIATAPSPNPGSAFEIEVLFNGVPTGARVQVPAHTPGSSNIVTFTYVPTSAGTYQVNFYFGATQIKGAPTPFSACSPSVG